MTSEETLALLNAPDYRAFMSHFFAETSQPRKKKLSYAQFSRRAGFQSRAHVRDILTFRRRVVPGNFDRVCAGLQLKGNLREYFKILVMLEHPTAWNANSDLNQHKARLKILRSRILRRLEGEKLTEKPAVQDSLIKRLAPTVYAACGKVNEGATLAEICQRSRLSPDQVSQALQALIQIGVLEQNQDRYLPVSTHLAMKALGSHPYFEIDFLESLKRCEQRLSQIKTDSSLFFTSTLCVRESDMKKLREKLQNLVLEFVDESENSEGDCISEIVLGFTRPMG